MEWISVEDRLPRFEGIVIVYCGQGHGLGTYDPSSYNWRIQPFFGKWYKSRNCVTHWMSLPELPKPKRQYSYETSGIYDQSGYVIYDLDGKRIQPWDLIKALNNPLPDGLALLCGLGIMEKDDDG